MGIRDLVIGNLYIPGCNLATHFNNAINNKADYIYYKNSDGKFVRNNDKSLLDGLRDENWDIITMQQASNLSGLPNTYNSDLDNLISYVQKNKTDSKSKLVWHMTWAYQSDSTHVKFANYDNNQYIMYNSIVKAVQLKIITNPNFKLIIPTGTAIQNVRATYIGDTLTRDGYHLTYELGRYIAGVTWFKALTGLAINNLSYVPNVNEIPGSYLAIIKNAVNNAVSNPFSVTNVKLN